MSELKIQVVDDDAPSHPEDIEEATRTLRQDLLELDGLVVSEQQDTDVPAGARADVQTVLGVISLSVVTSGMYVRAAPDIKKLIGSVSRVTQNWLERNKGKKALIELPDGTKVDLTDHSESSTERILAALRADRTEAPRN